MKIKNLVTATFLISSLIFSTTITAYAENRSANNCEIYIKSMEKKSCGYNNYNKCDEVTVKVGWIGNDEYVKRVGFWGQEIKSDTYYNGGDPASKSPYSEDWNIILPSSTNAYDYTYTFTFPTTFGGRHLSGDPYGVGHYGPIDGIYRNHCAVQGTFFVETTKNTYWLNPRDTWNQLFVFSDGPDEHITVNPSNCK